MPMMRVKRYTLEQTVRKLREIGQLQRMVMVGACRGCNAQWRQGLGERAAGVGDQ
jgi:hypothetical protein